jgi:hypothetical protein
MKVVLILLFMIIAVTAVAVLLINLLYKFIVNFQPTTSKVTKDLATMKADIGQWASELVPWSREEMELLSFSQVKNIVKKNIGTHAKGIFTSIYHEPLIAYSFKKYVSGKLNALLYARTSAHEFEYRISDKGTQVIVDGRALGILQNGLLYGSNNRLLARVNKSEELALRPVLVNGREVGNLVARNRANKINPRAFEYLDQQMDETEETIFLSLAILDLVTQEIK